MGRPRGRSPGQCRGVGTMRCVGRLAGMIAASAGALSRATGRGGGTSPPGMVLNALEPGALPRLGSALGGGAVFISATNGKTSTARLLSACLRADGRDVTANAAGANLASGVTAALPARQRRRRAEEPRRRNRPNGESARCGGIGVFEVDEGALGQVAGSLQPRAMVLMNLFRDQLDRYGELEATAERWGDLARSLGPATTLVLNADDPALAHLGADRPRGPMPQPYWPSRASARIGDDLPKTLLFGVDDPGIGRPDLPHAADTVRCGNCGSPLHHDLVTVGHLGHWRCEHCGRRRPEPHVRARRVQLDGLDRLTLTIEAPNGVGIEIGAGLGGLHNAYNITAAVAAALALGVPADVVRSGIAGVQAGRAGEPRRAHAAAAAGEEPHGCQREHPLHAGGARIAAPAGGAERSHRGRPRPVVDLGRGLRTTVGPPGQPHPGR